LTETAILFLPGVEREPSVFECRRIVMQIAMLVLLLLGSGTRVFAEPGFSEKYERDYNIFNPLNQYRPDNPLNPTNEFDPNNPFNSINQFDPGNPANPLNQYNPNNPFNPINEFNPGNPLNPINQFNSTTPFQPLNTPRKSLR
jgi:hypothetical protein